MKTFRKIVSIAVSAALLASSMAFSISAGAAQTADSGAVSSEPNLRDKAEDGVILHAFNWSYNSIKENLPQIAAAGYSTVQTSPVTQPKDYGTSADVANQWWKLYQPVSFSVARSSWLGGEDELKALCEEAEKYNIKIIVDIVANHMANYVENGKQDKNRVSNEVGIYEPEIFGDYDSYFHSETFNADDSSATMVTRGHISDCPDLNTGNEYVQSKILGLLKQCIDCGVDGFRFDAAKHIETEDDKSVGSQFWVNTLDKAKVYYKEKTGKELFAYGEILNTAGTGRTPATGYTKRMRVTENKTGDNILVGINNGSTKMVSAATYPVSGAAKNAVLWAESHDTYMGDSGSAGIKNTSSIDDAKIAKAWAVVASKKDATALFFARPGTAKMGEAAGDLSYKSTVVSEVNKFHNAFADVNEEKTAVSGSFVYTARGDSGIVITNVNGYAADVSIEGTGMAKGEYTDTVTGAKFTVDAKGVLKGSMGDTGVAVVYKSTSTPRVLASVESGSFTTDTMTVQLTLENAVSGTYALENSKPVTFTGSPTIRIGSDYKEGETITLNLTATDSEGTTASSTYLYTKKKSTASGVYIFLNPEKKKTWTNINCYVYDEITKPGTGYSNGGWPGQEMKLDEASGMLYIEVPSVSVATTGGKSTESDFNLAESSNTYVIFNAVTKQGAATQYPAANALEKDKFKLNGQSHIFAATTNVSWETTDLKPTPVEVEATNVTRDAEETEPTEPVQKGVYGDADLNGTVTVSDVSLIQRHIAEFDPRLSGLAEELADVDGDGDVTVKDVTYIQIFLAEYATGYARTNEPYYGANSKADFFEERSADVNANGSAPTVIKTAKKTAASVGANESGIYGDANENGVVEITDVTAIQREIAEYVTRLTPLGLKLADVDTDGAVTIKDATCIQLYLAEFIADTGRTGEILSTGSFSVTASSNFFPQNTVEFSADTNKLTVTYFINSEKSLLETDWLLSYDGTVLQPVGSDYMPAVPSLQINTSPSSVQYGVSGNTSVLSLCPLKTSGGAQVPFVSATFNVLSAQDTQVSLNVKDLTLSKLNSGETTSHAANETDAVLNGVVKEPDSAYTLVTSVYSGALNAAYVNEDDPVVTYTPQTQPTETTEPTVPTQPQPGGTTVYLSPNANWLSDGARFAVYCYKSGGEQWVDMSAAGNNTYSVTLPDGQWTAIIFCRMNGATTANNWGNMWNQTDDLTDYANGRTYVITGWDNSGYWSN